MFKKKQILAKKPILMGRNEIRQEIQESNMIYKTNNSLQTRRKVVAITGTHDGTGCTHIALSLAYKLSNKYDVALVELDKKNDLIGFDTTYELKGGKLDSKKLGKLDLYFFEKNRLVDIFKQGYDYIILDIGTGLTVDDTGKIISKIELSEAYRADLKVLVTQTKEWQLKYLKEFIKYDGEMKDWFIFANMSTDKEFKELEKSLKGLESEVKKIPYFSDPFDINVKEIEEVFAIIEF